MQKISGKQCAKARALLKWNLQDLSNKLQHILPGRLDSFEKGVLQLFKWENDALCIVLVDAGIMLTSDFEVVLKTKKADEKPINMGMQGEGARIVLDAELNIISDTSEGKMTGVAVIKPEEEPPLE